MSARSGVCSCRDGGESSRGARGCHVPIEGVVIGDRGHAFSEAKVAKRDRGFAYRDPGGDMRRADFWIGRVDVLIERADFGVQGRANARAAAKKPRIPPPSGATYINEHGYGVVVCPDHNRVRFGVDCGMPAEPNRGSTTKRSAGTRNQRAVP
jgi:hypothetical protein